MPPLTEGILNLDDAFMAEDSAGSLGKIGCTAAGLGLLSRSSKQARILIAVVHSTRIALAVVVALVNVAGTVLALRFCNDTNLLHKHCTDS